MRRILLTVLLLGLPWAPAAHAEGQAVIRKAPSESSLEGVTIPNQIQVTGKPLLLNGIALRKKAVFKVYVAGLYLSQKSRDAESILGADEPRCLVMQFLRSVSADRLCEAWDEDLEANTPDASAGVRSEYKTLCAFMENVSEGEQLSFTYLPGAGTTVRVQGKSKGTLPGKDFADALYRSWIGPHPGPGSDFKRALLGG